VAELIPQVAADFSQSVLCPLDNVEGVQAEGSLRTALSDDVGDPRCGICADQTEPVAANGAQLVEELVQSRFRFARMSPDRLRLY